MGAALGLIGPLASIGGALAGGGSTASNVQPTFGTGFAQGGALNGIQGLGSSTIPGAGASTQFLINNPGTGPAQQGADVAGGLGKNAGMQQFYQGQNLVNTGNSVVPYAYQALNAGFDPQSNVYKQQFQQNTDQTRALLEARGIDSTPYGAGVEAQSDLNFNNAWEANTLARQGQGAATANSLFNTQAGDVLQGSNLSGQAPGTYFAGASLPYTTNQTIGQNQLAAYGAFQGLQQQPIQDYLSYLGYGTQQQNANVNQNQVGFNQNQTLGQGLGAGLQGLSKGWQSYANNNNVGWGAANPGAAGSSYYGPVAA